MKNRHNLDRQIPEDVKRAVRKRDGFGCVICGNAFIEYDHFDPEFANAVEHRVEGIALLCPYHHDQKEDGTITEEDYALARQNPKALLDGFAGTEWSMSSVVPEIVFGDKTFCGGTSIMKIDNEVVLGFNYPDDNSAPPTVNFRAFDREGIEAVHIVDNEILVLNDAFDIEKQASKWTLRSKKHYIDLIIKFDPPTRVTIERLRFKHGHWGIDLKSSQFDLTFNDQKVIGFQGRAKIQGECLYKLSADAPKIHSENMDIQFGIAPAPIGSIPMNGKYEVRWPNYLLWDTKRNQTMIHEVGNKKILSIYLLKSIAEKCTSLETEVRTITIQELIQILFKLISHKLIDSVTFNAVYETVTQEHEPQEFLKKLMNLR